MINIDGKDNGGKGQLEVEGTPSALRECYYLVFSSLFSPFNHITNQSDGRPRPQLGVGGMWAWGQKVACKSEDKMLSMEGHHQWMKLNPFFQGPPLAPPPHRGFMALIKGV